jgi:hypothetical protein
MVQFETIKAEEITFGNNNFIEVAKKKAVTEEGENVFISVSRGFKNMQGERRYRKSFTVPMDKDVIEFVSKMIKEMGKGAEKIKTAEKGEDFEKELEKDDEDVVKSAEKLAKKEIKAKSSKLDMDDEADEDQ